MQTILQVNSIYKSFGSLKAVNGVSFGINEGQCFGLLGPNGAGKSTTIEIIETIQKPDSGEILYKGEAITKDFTQSLGVQFQETSLPLHLTVYETLKSFSQLYDKGIDLEQIIDMCQLTPFLHQMHDKISGGQKQRLLLSLALCHDPQVILLDEPTTGLDPQARRHLWQIVDQIKKQGKTILLTTHYMDEAYELCDEIAIMDHGKIIAQGTPEKLLNTFFNKEVITLNLPQIEKSIFQNNETIVSRPRSSEIHTEKTETTIKSLIANNISLEGITIRRSNLEDLFIELTGKDLRK
jgi:ABC-2 type transport system ATP-binding protein